MFRFSDGNQLTEGLGQIETIESPADQGQILYTTSQTIDLEIRPDYDGRLLVCSAENLAIQQRPQEIKVPISVVCKYTVNN